VPSASSSTMGLGSFKSSSIGSFSGGAKTSSTPTLGSSGTSLYDYASSMKPSMKSLFNTSLG
jgi:hypothetical protein